VRIHDLFFATAERTPDRAAVVEPAGTTSYGELAEMARAIALSLGRELRSGSRVGIVMQKSARAIATMLGVLDAGCAYVPIDPGSPATRRDFVTKDAELSALVLDEAGQQLLTDAQRDSCPFVIDLGTDGRPRVRVGHVSHRVPSMDSSETSDSLAYVLYTSGSTGEPKGVAITHSNARAFVEWALEQFDVDTADRVAVHAALHFDLPVFDVYCGLARGATLYPIPGKVAQFPQALYRFLKECRVSVLYAVPSALRSMVDRSTIASSSLSDLRLLLYAGEEFASPALARLMAALPSASVFNLYGPVETNVVTFHAVRASDLHRERIPIGRPVNGTRILLRGEDGTVVQEPDREGEITVDGPSVSPGYLNRPELTRDSRGEVLLGGKKIVVYRTGDYGRWDRDGLLNFHGRRDDMVKTRGYRVELGEIESVMARHAAVSEVAVIAIPDATRTNVLMAFATVRDGAGLTPEELRSWCRSQLPGYMVPSETRIIESMPRTGTGKIARRVLAELLVS
jgi:amino acid adenylation domain-containing protein